MNKKEIINKEKVCFISLSAYPLLLNVNQYNIGGAEIQQVEIAKELKNRGYEITFITYKVDKDNIPKNLDFHIIPVYPRVKVKNLSLLKKFLDLWGKLKQVDSNIFFYRTGYPVIISIFCWFNRKKLIKSVASDSELMLEFIHKKTSIFSILEKVGNWIDIFLSDVVIVQNSFQKSRLKKKFKINSCLIKNAIRIPIEKNLNEKKENILWIGSLYPNKRPELFLEIAKQFPEQKFIMIGGEVEGIDTFKKIEEDSKKIKNLSFLGFINREMIFEYYNKASLLISTSKVEGFPNIFLEAWLHSIPVVSLNVDPDGIISKYKLGYSSKNFNQMIENIHNLLEDKELLKIMGENGRKYIEENHDIEKITNQYENIIHNLVKNH